MSLIPQSQNITQQGSQRIQTSLIPQSQNINQQGSQRIQTSQIHESQNINQQGSLQHTNKKQQEGYQLVNLNKHTSYVFALTLHEVILQESFDKCKEFDDEINSKVEEQYHPENMVESQENSQQKEEDKAKKKKEAKEELKLKIKKELWQEKIEKGKVLKQSKCFLVSAGADKNIYLWDIDNIGWSNNSQVQTEPTGLQQKPKQKNQENKNSKDNQENKNNQSNQENNDNKDNQDNQDNLTQDELKLRHVIIPQQNNLYEFVTCLCSVKINENENTSYLVVGYENNQIIRYEIFGEYWMRNNLKYQFKQDDENPKIKPLNPHNDAVRSIVYLKNQLYSCGDDMKLLIQNIEGEVKKQFYFDSIIENLYIWNDHLIFPHYNVDLQVNSKLENELLQTANNLQQAEVNQQQQGAIQQRVQQVEKHSYLYSVQCCLMMMEENQQNNFDIILSENKQNYEQTLEDAFNRIDKITCFVFSDDNNYILYSTESGKLILIQDPLNNPQNKIVDDNYKDRNNSIEKYQYKVIDCPKRTLYDINKIIMSFIKCDTNIYIFSKDKVNKEQVFLYIGQQIEKSDDLNKEPQKGGPISIQYLAQYVKQKENNAGQNNQQNPANKGKQEEEFKSYEVFLQNPLFVKEGNTKIILLCGDQLRYYNL